MTLVGSRYRIEECDLTRFDDDAIAPVARMHAALEAERLPDDPPTPLELVARRLRNRPSQVERTEWIVRDDGEVVGSAMLQRWRTMDNPHWREAWIGVHPDHRRNGIARELLRHIVDAAGDDPEIVLASWANDRVPGGWEFARAIGATEGLNNRTSELRVAEIDRALVAEWAHLHPDGYRLVWIDGDMPDELVPNVIAAYDLMNTAPRGELQMGDWHTTAAEIRDWERVRQRNGGERRLVLAIHAATGATAGFTEVGRHPLTPWSVQQQGTAVTPEHRGHGIGKWIKAAMIERILREWGDARVIRTGNAYVNAPMLSINDRLGFKVIWSVVVWQLKRADAERYLETHAG